MEGIVVGLMAAAGGIWRRWFGGWLSHTPRYIKLGVAAVLSAGAVKLWEYPVDDQHKLVALIALWLGLVALWVMGHKWHSVSELLVRYSAPTVALAVMAGFVTGSLQAGIVAGIAAAVIPVVYTLGHRGYFDWVPYFGKDFVDGGIAVAEILSGAAVFGLFAAAFWLDVPAIVAAL